MPETLRELVLGSRSSDQTRAVGEQLGRLLVGGDVVVLAGALGAGKTTFVQGMAVGLGVTAAVTSPTFVLARHLRPDPAGPRSNGPDLVHVDAYRLTGALELDDLDLDSDLDRSVVVVEWGEGLAERLSPDRIEVALTRPSAAGVDTRRSDAAGVDAAGVDAAGDDAAGDDAAGDDAAGSDATGDEDRTVRVRLVGSHRFDVSAFDVSALAGLAAWPDARVDRTGASAPC